MGTPRNLSKLAENTDSSGVLGIASGGTGGSTAAAAKSALNLHAVASSGSYADLNNKPTTANITEDTNLYYTDARARAAVSATGNLSYNSTTGVFSYTTPSTSGITEGTNLYFTDARVRAAVSAGTGLSYNSTTGVFSTSLTQYTDALARAAVSAGTGLSYNSTTGVFSTSLTQYTDALARAAVSATGSLSYNSTTGVFSYTTPSTSGIDEGSNLYYTDVRARAAHSAGTGISYNSTTGAISSTITQYTDALARAAVSAGTGLSYNSSTGVFTNTITQYTDALAVSANTSAIATAKSEAIASAATDATNKANAAQAAAIAAVTNGAGAAFDTLKEIQDAMATDAELAAAIASITVGNATQTIAAGTGLSGGGSFTANQTAASTVTLSLGTAGTAGTYTKVTTDAYGRVTSGTTLGSGDIPSLSGIYLPLTGGTLTGKVTFPSANANQPQMPNGFLGLDTGDGNFDIWGISRDYYPSNSTAANAWGICWDGDSNQIRFIGGGSARVAFDLDDGTTQINGNTVLHAANYNSYSPTLTGTGASGTWAINITGSAATATDNTKLPLAGGTLTGNVSFAQGANISFGTSTNEAGPWTISVIGSGGATPATKGTGRGRNLIIQAGASDNGAGLAGGDMFVRGGNPTSPSVVYGDVRLADLGGQVYLRSGEIALGSSNYNSYSPTLTGTGASGTWNISITGSAATATDNTKLPLAGGTLTGTTYINTGGGYPLQLSSSQRYMLQLRNTGNSINSGYGWWFATDTNFNFAMHADGLGDVLTLTRSGALTLNGNTVLNAGNYNSYSPTLTGTGASGTWGINISGNAATATTASNINNFLTSDGWVRTVGDSSQLKFYGNSRTMIYRTDGNTNEHGGSGYAHIFYYGGSADNQRMFIINTDGRLYSPYHGWLDTMSVAYASSAGTADQIDGRAFRNTGDNSAVNADTLESNGITYYTAGVPNFSGNATDGALYSQAYNGNWQHQIAGDYRSGQIALRGKNSGTWQSWRTVLDSSNVSTYAHTISTNPSTAGPGTLAIGNQGSYSYVQSHAGQPLNLNPVGNPVSVAGNAVLHAGNYTSYSPSLGGSGASGTWGINITGNAATASKTTANAGYARVGYGMAPFYNWGGANAGAGAPSDSTYTTGIDVGSHPSDQAYGFQIASNMWNVGLWTRTYNSGFSGWVRILDSSNYSSYALPLSGGTLTGQLTVPNSATAISIASGYFIGNGSWGLRNSTPSGYIEFGPANTSYAHIYTDRPSFYFNAQLEVLGNRVLNAGNYTSYSPSLGGSGASGTWGISISGSAASVGGLTPAQFFNNMGNNHGTYTNFNSVPGFGAYYVQQGTNSPTGVGAHQWYGFTLGLGNEYPLSQYGTQIYWPRRAQNGETYVYVRDIEGSSWTSWNKIRAGFSDSTSRLYSTDSAYNFNSANPYYGYLTYDGSRWLFQVSPATPAAVRVSYADNAGNSTTTSQSTFGDLYTNSWFRNNNSNQGLYNQVTTQHWSSNANGYWDASSTTSHSGIRLYTGGHVSAIRGYVYADTSNHVGFLNQDGSWRLRVVSGDYSLADGSSMRAQIFYDSNDTAYYTDPAGGTSFKHQVLRGAWNTSPFGGGQEQFTIRSSYPSYCLRNTDTGSYWLVHHAADQTINWYGGAGGVDGSNWSRNLYLDMSGNLTARNNITAYSDIRLKTNIKLIDNPLEKVKRLRGVYFNWKETGILSVGMIAQEVELVFPELVLTSNACEPGKEDYKETKSLDYSKIVSVLVEAIKEQDQEVVDLKTRVAQLEALINKLIKE